MLNWFNFNQGEKKTNEPNPKKGNNQNEEQTDSPKKVEKGNLICKILK